MPEVLLTFLDGEVVPAETQLIDFHQTVLSATSKEPGGNNREFMVPLSSLKYVVFGGEVETDEDVPLEELTKVVIHFQDHEVLRAYAGRSTLGGPHGIIYTLVDPDRRVRRKIGVPYTAVKAIFKVKRWDGRGKDQGPTFARVARILAEREKQERAERVGKVAPRPRRTPLLDRSSKSR